MIFKNEEDSSVTQLIGVRLTTPVFSCNLWLPCPETENAPQAIDRLVFDVVNAISQIDPDLSDAIEISEYQYWPPLNGLVEI